MKSDNKTAIYLKQHRRGTYTTLLTEGRLNEHLHEIDVQAREQAEWIIDQLSARMCHSRRGCGRKDTEKSARQLS